MIKMTCESIQLYDVFFRNEILLHSQGGIFNELLLVAKNYNV